MRLDPSNEVDQLLREGILYCIDLLPQQVPEHTRGQYFAVEKYYLSGPLHERLCRQFGDVLLKLNCYHDLLVNHGGDEWIRNPKPELLMQWLSQGMDNGQLYVLIDDGEALITAFGGDTHISLYSPSPGLLELVGRLVTAAGLFLWQV